MNIGTREACMVVAGLALFIGGCNKALNYEKTLALEPGEIQSFEVDAPARNQKVTVTFKSSAAPVDVYIVLEKDFELVSQSIKNYKKPGPVLNQVEKSREGSISADIPAKSDFGVIVAGSPKDTSVQVKLTSN